MQGEGDEGEENVLLVCFYLLVLASPERNLVD